MMVDYEGTDQRGNGHAGVFYFDEAGIPVAVTAVTALPVSSQLGAPVAANVLVGSLSHTATTAAASFLTVPAGRTWSGVVGASCAVAIAAASSTAGRARAVITTAGVGVTPAAGTVLAIEAKAGANAATGTVGSSASNAMTIPLVVVAPAGNSVTLQLESTITGTAGVVDVSASGALI